MFAKLGGLGLLKLLIRAISTHATHQAAVARELHLLNAYLREKWPLEAPPVAPGEVPPVEDEGWDLGEVQFVREVLQQELGREASDDEVLARLRWRQARERNEVMPKGAAGV